MDVIILFSHCDYTKGEKFAPVIIYYPVALCKGSYMYESLVQLHICKLKC